MSVHVLLNLRKNGKIIKNVRRAEHFITFFASKSLWTQGC